MQKSNAEILNHFYSVLIEINFHRPEELIWEDKDYREDPFIQKNLQKIKLLSAKYKALRTKSMYSNLIDEMKQLRDYGFDKIKKMLNPQEIAQLQPLFNKFEELTQKDEASIQEDQELLQLLKVLKDKINEASDGE